MASYAFISSFRKHITSSVLLLVATLLALVVANGPFGDDFRALWQLPMSLSIGDFNFFSHGGHVMSLGDVINDFLMAVFFLSVGLEIKREVLCGELSSLRRALAPVIGAIGGMLMPVVMYLLVSPSDPVMERGMAIPMATDIAFSLGCLSVFSRRCPTSLKVFLAALAVADDLGGILVIAVKYSEHLNLEYLALVLACLVVLMIGNRRMVRTKLFYLSMGLILWYAMLNSGIHATISGVVLAMCVPAGVDRGARFYLRRISEHMKQFPVIEVTRADRKKAVVLNPKQVNALKSIESASDHLISVLQDLEDSLRTPINYYIIPLFALANAGVQIEAENLTSLFSGVGLAVFLGLWVGKFVGVFSFSWICIKLRIIEMPRHATWPVLASVCMICGIGFTVAMFMANLAFHGGAHEELLNDAKLGILAGSLVSALVGSLMLNLTLPSEEEMAALKAQDRAAAV